MFTAHRGFRIYYFVQSLKWSYEMGGMNTVDHLLLLKIVSSFWLSRHSLFPNVSPTCLLCWFIPLHFYMLEAPEVGLLFVFTHCLKVLSSDLMTSHFIQVLKTHVSTLDLFLNCILGIPTPRSKRSVRHNLAKTFLLFSPHLYISASLSALLLSEWHHHPTKQNFLDLFLILRFLNHHIKPNSKLCWLHSKAGLGKTRSWSTNSLPSNFGGTT